MEPDREFVTAFCLKHQSLYDLVSQALVEAVEEGDTRALSVHVAVFTRCIETALNLSLAVNGRHAAGNV